MSRFAVVVVLVAAACVAAPAIAGTIRLDEVDAEGTVSGSFSLHAQDVAMPAQEVFEVLHMTAGSDFAAAGADGVGDDRSVHHDLSLAKIIVWMEENGLPTDGRMIVTLDVSAPAQEPATTAVIKRLSLRLGDTVFKLTDTVVVPSRRHQFGELRLILDPGFAPASRSSWDLDSFRISADIAAPPGTTVVAYLSGEPKGILEETAAGQMPGSVMSRGAIPQSGLRLAGAAGGAGGVGASAGTYSFIPSAGAGFYDSFEPAQRARVDYTTLEPGLPADESTESAKRDDDTLDPVISDDPVLDPEDDPIVPIDDPEIPDPKPTPNPPTKDDPGKYGPGDNPVPEPTSLILLAGGALVVGRRRR